MNEDKIKELRAHAGKLVAEGKSLSGAFTYIRPNGASYPYQNHRTVPDFEDGNEWCVGLKPKKQLIKWEHPYFKGCAVSIETFGDKKHFEFMAVNDLGQAHLVQDHPQAGFFPDKSAIRLVAPATPDSNWQYFRSTPENDAKLRELAKMVKVNVRYWSKSMAEYVVCGYNENDGNADVSNFRITGECQDKWTDDKEEVV